MMRIQECRDVAEAILNEEITESTLTDLDRRLLISRIASELGLAQYDGYNAGVERGAEIVAMVRREAGR